MTSMKKNLLVLIPLLALASGPLAAGPGHEHTRKVAGPNGGRVLTAVEPHAEFLVLPDRRLQITFLDDQGRPRPPESQEVVVVAGERSSPTRLLFSRAGGALVSDGPLPAGNRVPAVVQIRPAAGAKVVNERFNVDTSICPPCKLAEYACTCDH
jgi:hypothetical protein